MNYDDSKKELKRLAELPAKTKEELISKLKALAHAEKHTTCDTEAEHVLADKALLEFINDPEVTAAFESIGKWYA